MILGSDNYNLFKLLNNINICENLNELIINLNSQINLLIVEAQFKFVT